MSRGRVLLTGASGFIGSHIAAALLAAGYQVLALRRASSSLRRVSHLVGPLNWVDINASQWEAQVLAWQPEYLVHAAWLGVSAGQRNDWASQLTNLEFTVKLLELMAAGPARQVLALGSQAEYGQFNGRIAETAPANPTTAYGALKLATLDVLRAFCQAHNLAWHWMRVFAVFGPQEDAHWFVSHVIGAMLAQQPLQLTACEQRYDYVFVRDLAQALVAVLGADEPTSGVYNVSANAAVPLKKIVETVRTLTHSTSPIYYGAVPYRPGQSMHLEGNSDHFNHTFGSVATTPLREALAETITFARNLVDL